MKTGRTLSAVLALSLLGLAGLQAQSKVEFTKGSLPAIKEKAAAENKPVYLEFMTDWCEPCKDLAQNAYSDSEVANLLNGQYVAMRINADDFDGYAIKRKLDVKYLPTIIILNAKGEETGRYLESMKADELKSVLRAHTNPAHRMPADYGQAKYTHPPLAPATTTASTATEPAKAVAAGDRPTPATPRPKNADKPVAAAPKPAPVRVQEEQAPARVSKPAPAASAATASSGQEFCMQAGVFSNKANAMSFKTEMEQLFNQPVVLHTETASGKSIYKVLVGRFKSYDEANRFKDAAKTKSINGFIKSYTAL